MKRILIIDAHNACWRLMKKLPILSTKGQPVQVIYGFLRLLRSVIEQFEPNAVLVCWDTGHSEFRKKTFPGYKAGRNHHASKELSLEFGSVSSQMDEIKAILPLLNVGQLEYPGTEADDLIGFACDTLEGHKTVISSDMDMLQLVGGGVDVWSPLKTELFTALNFKKKMDLSPIQYLHLKALIGDKSDGIPGVARGFGEVTAKELIKKYGGIEILFQPALAARISKKGNRYALLYSEGTQETVYRNLLLMDLAVCAQHVPDSKTILKKLNAEIESKGSIDVAEIKKYFLDKSFVSLLTNFGLWIAPFETLD